MGSRGARLRGKGGVMEEAFEQFEAICRALADPTFYPHPVTRLERRDTHISTVFLTGSWVYKLKKPVSFGFLDFSGLDARKHFCRQEVVLNRRLSHNVYADVVAICRDPSGSIRLGKDGRVLEYAVKMRQLPEDASLLEKVKSGTVTSAEMIKLGRTLADFYRSGEAAEEIRKYGDPDLIAANMEDNFRQTEPFLDSILDREKWELIAHVGRSFLAHNRRLFILRVQDGHIRDGHGDLRPDHVYFCRGIQIIDCIEFNDSFRFGDAAIDLAFLHMDLDRMGGLEWGVTALAAYAEAAKDPTLYRLLDFYACYRAMVRVKVDCLHSTQLDAAARTAILRRAAEYLDQAYCHAVQFSRATLWLVCGMPASGKTTVADAVAQLLEVPHIQSDAVRQEIARLEQTTGGVTAYGEGLYHPGRKQQVYARMLGQAHDHLREGRSVVLDATFSEKKWRSEAVRLAADTDCNLVAVECVAAESTMKERLRSREEGPSLSDARLQHFAEFRRDFEPLTELPPLAHLPITTERALEPLLTDLIAQAYRLQCLQVRERIRF